MKIRFLHDNFNIAGGVERNVINFANEFISRNLSVEIICFGYIEKNNILIKELNPKVRLKQIGSKTLYNILPLPIYYAFALMISFFYCLFNRDADLTISQKHYVDIVSILANKLSFNKSKLMCISSSYLSMHKKTKPSFSLFASIFLIAKLYKFADFLGCISKRGVKDFKTSFNISKQKINVIYNPIITQDYFTEKRIKPKHLFFNKNNKVIISAGRLVKEKNVDIIINAFARIPKKLGAKLIIFGTGYLKDDLEKLIKINNLQNDVILMGESKDTKELQDYFAASDLFVMPSSFEGFGNVLVEALAEGLPCIVSKNVTAAYEIEKFKEQNEIVNKLSADAFAKAMIKKLEKLPSKKEKLQIKDIVKDFTAKNSVNKILDLI